MQPYNILHLEDSETDADLVKRIINNAGIPCNIFLAATKDEFIQGLETFKPDMILCDHTLPSFNSKTAFIIAKERYANIPFLLVTGTVSEEFAVEMIKNGVDDYLLKYNLQRLPIAITNAFAKRVNEEKIKAMQIELLLSEANLRSIFDNSATGLVLLDQTGIILELNKQTNYFAKLTLNKYLKKTDNLLEQLPENKKQDLKEKLAIVLNGEPIEYYTSYLQENGKNIIFNVRLFPVIDRQGNKRGVAINFEDVTQQKEAEQRYSNLFHLSPLPMWVVDLETFHFLDVNKAAVTKYMYNKEEFMNMVADDITSSTNEKTLMGEDLDPQQQEQLFDKSRIVKHYKKNGELILANIECINLIYKTKRAELVLATDVTEKMNYIAAIEQQNNQLLEIAWTQSHVVRAPLARMMGIVNLINNNMHPSELAEWKASFNESANELNKIIKDITKKTKNIN
ncbi:MAG: PAS domain S-box protein [Sediminibacterium sp.]|nr:PAS domain S-box protein [Sediminibacterium sp.]